MQQHEVCTEEMNTGGGYSSQLGKGRDSEQHRNDSRSLNRGRPLVTTSLRVPLWLKSEREKRQSSREWKGAEEDCWEKGKEKGEEGGSAFCMSRACTDINLPH